MKYLLLVLNFACLALPSFAAEEGYPALKAEAEKLYQEGSYQEAHELYLKAAPENLPKDEARWVRFRLADTLWRSQAGTNTADPTRYQKAEAELNALVRDAQRAEDRDQVWAEVEESLGDFYWTRPDSRNWGGAWNHYQQSLDWWAGSKEIDPARDRYLRIVWKAASPPWKEPHYYYGYYGNVVPLPVVENVLEIAVTADDRARAHYLVAMTLRQQGDPYQQDRVRGEFEAALQIGKTTDWYDDALYHFGEWLMSHGQTVVQEDGQVRLEPDFVKALEVFRRLLREHQKGETRYFDQATNQIQNITRPSLGVGVGSYFLPEAEVQYQLSWRNLKKIELALYPFDLTRDVNLAGDDKSAGAWLQAVDLTGREKARSWSFDTKDQGLYRPGSQSLRVEGKLPPGAYLLEAAAGGLSARDLVLVSNATLVLKTSGKQALLYFADALAGSPIAGARVNLWERFYDGRRWHWRETARETDRDGLAVFDLQAVAGSLEIFAGASAAGRQAFAVGSANRPHGDRGSWRIYVQTDRPAYRPGESAQWKLLARTYDGSVYSTPSGQTIEYEIHDPRGAKAGEGTATLNEFGSAWGSLELTESMPLGEYRVNFWNRGRKAGIGGAVLLRLEEYKLPEFKVAIQTPEEDGKRKTFRLGEQLQATISAEYYFGGAVADATVEAVVYQKPFYHYWAPEREYPWYYQDLMPQYGYWGGPGRIVKRETLKTDASGKAVVSIETPRGAGQDLEYRIEARVTDSSRREIVGSDSVRVTRQSYYVTVKPLHNLYRPGDKVRVGFKALDPNQSPVAAEGKVKVSRDTWVEVWLSPQGKEVRGRELDALRAEKSQFPPPGEAGWRIKFRGYEHEDVLNSAAKTDAAGDAELTFTAAKEGYYSVTWQSPEKGGPPIRSGAVVWVLTNASADIGYRTGGVEIMVDQDTFRAGQKAPVMLSVPVSDRYVLFSVEGESLYHYRLVHVTGTVKLLELEIGEQHIPNVFLSAVMVGDREIFQDQKQVIVPPVDRFLQVEVKADRADYLPREEGTLTVTARDHQGKPVEAEVALSLVDASVYYIQSEYAGDPRQFFYGEKRGLLVQTQSTLDHKRFFREQQKNLRGEDSDEMQSRDWYYEKDKADGQFGGAGGRRRQDFFQKRENLAAKMSRESRAEGAADALMDLRSATIAGVPAAPAEMEELKQQGGEEPAVQVRSDFRSTILWEPGVRTDRDGVASVKVRFPDSLTSWRFSARAGGRESVFGAAAANVRTRQPLIVRLQAPRFFVIGDSAVISAVINNNTDRPLAARAALEAEGLEVKGWLRDGKLSGGEPEPITVYPGGEARADWLVEVRAGGSARLKVTARSEKHADAMEKTYPIHEHGIEKFLSRSGKLRGEAATVKLDLPRERKADSTFVTVQVAPSLAVTMLDALPYLADYPYGCTEQTMSRFLPATITARTLRELGLDAEAVEGKLFGGIVAEHAAKTHPGGKKDLRKLTEMTQQGLERLYAFQHSDGGWGWWKEGESDHFMTAYVVWGLVLARQADLDVKPDVIERGASFLDKEIVEEEEHPDLQAWMLHALAAHHASTKKAEVGRFQAKAVENLWKNRDRLNAYTRALFALAVHHYGDAQKAQVLVRNLQNGVKTDAAPDTSVVLEGPQESQQGVVGNAHWGEDGIWWRWSDGGVEATATVLRALVTIDPGNKLVEPAANWLVKNRRGAQWSNTRDTAMCVLALNDYLKKSGELGPEVEYELIVNGESILSRKITAGEALRAPSRFPIDRQRLRETGNEVRIARKSGKSPLYFAVEARFFSQEEPVTPAGNEIFVRREYQKLSPRPTLLKGYVHEELPLLDQGKVESGERVDVILTIEAKNNYEYLVFEDLKPAGLEAVEVKSGTPVYARELKSGAVDRKFPRKAAGAAAAPGAPPGAPPANMEESDYTGRSRWVYQELRDRKVALFIDKLPEGVWEIRYQLRAEVPGKFHALPVLGHAMYVPEIRANGAEIRIEVEDRKPEAGHRFRRAVVEGGGK